MTSLKNLLKHLPVLARAAVAEFARLTAPPTQVQVRVKSPQLSYSLRHRQRLEWMSLVCRSRY